MTRLATSLAISFALVPALASPAHAEGAWTWPLRGEVITPYRNGSDPYARGQHRGIDIAGGVGAPVVAATAGSVRFAGSAGSSGRTVSVRSVDGRYDTSYLHLGSISVRAGQRLRAGERVGSVGTSGRRSAARPHLHFGVRVAGSRHAYRDPLDFLPVPPVTRPDPAPRGAPAPVDVPVVPAPAPVVRPLSVPGPAGRRVRLPARRRVPAGRPGLWRAPEPVPAPAPSPLRTTRPVPGARRSPERVHGSPLAPEPGAAKAKASAPPRSRAPAPSSHSGPDLGLLLGCLGLLLASALLGFWPGDDRTRRQPGARSRSLWRPVVARIAQGRRT